MATIEKTRPTTKPETKPEKPKLFRVILINDDYTPRELVVLVLRSVFNLSASRAYHVMMTAHRKGACVIALYTLEIAETRVHDATELAKHHGAALGFNIEPDE